ncbi:MAG: TolC family protein [Paludibacter sp.]|jgi:outer membrane protein|nr:TolC family protein [Paludibacter sp.]
MKKFIIAVIIVHIAGFAMAQKLMTLEECITIALDNNLNVKQLSNTDQSRQIAYNQARNALLPNLSASAQQSLTLGRSLDENNSYRSANSTSTSFGISSSITIFDGLRMKYNIDATRAEKKASESDLSKIKSDIAMSVSTAYLNALMNKELLQTSREQLTLTQQNIEQRRKLVETGRMVEGELYEFISQEAREELALVEAENALKLSLLDLAQIMEIPDFETIDVSLPETLYDESIILQSASAIYEQALDKRPEIRSAEFRVQASEKSVSMAKSGYYPSLSLGASLGTNYYNLQKIPAAPFDQQLQNHLNANIGLNLSIPIFNRFETQSGVKNANLQARNARLTLDQEKLNLQKNIQQAYGNATTSKSRWQAAEKAERAAQESFRFTQQKCDAGRATQFELFQAKNNLTKAQSENTRAKYEFAFRLKILELYIGR